MSFFSSECVLFDCATGAHRVIDKATFTIGSAPECDWCIEDPAVAAEHCVIERRGRRFFLSPVNGTETLLFDGADSEGGELTANEDHTLIVAGHPLALRGGAGLQRWLHGMNPEDWYIFDKTTHEKFGPCAFAELPGHLEALERDPQRVIFLCRGLTTMGFFAGHVLPFLPVASAVDAAHPSFEPHPDHAAIDVEYGEFTCPVCWLKFDRGDAMNVAVHASLRGDPILGEAQMQRFYPSRFNDRDQALDAMGVAAPDLACPHCRRKLPPGFLDAPHHIFSIVGAPSSGKSYYLSVLVKMLQTTLYQQFGVAFRDADPSENVILNQMKTQLFSAATPQEAVLAKTELEGAMYETLPRLGRKVRLPKPFVFKLSNSRDHSQDFSVVFYDNAGEHFEPTRNSADSPGAQHIAAASGIFFLFDPLHNAEFRRRLTGLHDPQLELHRMDQQDIILAETEVRMKSLLGLDIRQRVATPLAVIVGKSDTWGHLLAAPILPAIADGHLDLASVRRNSDNVRRLLLEVHSAIVSNAEEISSEVMYFAASPLGCSPLEFTDARGVKMIGPDPQKLNPQHVEIPTLWVLSRVAPGMVPSTGEGGG